MQFNRVIGPFHTIRPLLPYFLCTLYTLVADAITKFKQFAYYIHMLVNKRSICGLGIDDFHK